MSFLRDCGVMGYIDMLFILLGIVLSFTVGRKNGRPVATATTLAFAALALGAIGFSFGLHAVERAVITLPESELPKKVAFLAIGDREAVRNLLLGGAGALVILLCGWIASFTVKPKQATH